MKNKLRWLGVVLIVVSIVFILFMTFPGSMISGADAAIGPLQLLLIVAGINLLVFSIDIVLDAVEIRNVFNKYLPMIPFYITGLILYLVSVWVGPLDRPALKQINNFQWAVSWLILAVLLYSAVIKPNQRWILDHISRATKNGFVAGQHHYWIVIAIIIVSLSVVSDIFRGAVWVYTLFLTMGLGVSLWLISPKKRLTFAPVFAPIIGYAITSVFGSWLVMLNFPINTWAANYTIIVILLNLLLVAVWIKKNPSWRNHLDWKNTLNDLSIGYFAVILIVLPVVIGDMKFSTFRGNPDDAHNYMSMAFYLANIPFSLHIKHDILFQFNPAIFLGGGSLGTRWTTSMLMAYSSLMGRLSIYRFDFAFSALPFALLPAPIYKTLKETGLEIQYLFPLTIAISAGYYEQIVLDSRAVSYCTSLPVMLGFVFLIARIWDDKESHFRGWPIYFGEILFLIILMLALFTLYPEISTILGLGVFISGLYYILYRSVQVKKAITLFLCAVSSVLIIYVTLPVYIKFLTGQIIGSQNMYVNWHTHFFSWIFNDFPSGVWGLNPYQINDVLSSIINVYAYLLTAILIAAWGILIFRRLQAGTVVQLSGFIMTAGAILFAYMYFRGQYWQAGKMFTFVYPFMMIFITFIPYEIKGVNSPYFPPILPRVLQALILCWLVLLAGTSLYRFVVVTNGTEYPFYVGGTGHTSEDYHLVYNWETQRFIDSVKKPGNVVWLASNTAFEDVIWALSMPPDVKVFNTHPIIGSATPTFELNQMYLTSNLPDYLIVSNDIWPWNENATNLEPILFDQVFSLIKLARQLPDTPLLIGMRNNQVFHSPGDYWVGQEGWLAFLSPATCEALLSGDGLTMDKYPSVNFMVDSKPAKSEKEYTVATGHPFQVRIPLMSGYNFVSLKITDEFLADTYPGMPTIYFQDLEINYVCDQDK